MTEEQLFDAVFDAILSRRLPPGTKLTEASLCEIFGVKRNAVRKVLSQLAAKKMVDLQFNRGAFVASPTVEEARDIFEVRRVLESGIATKLATTVPPLPLGHLRELVRQERQYFVEKDYPHWVRHSLEFHIQLAQLAGNDVMSDYVKDLVYRAPLISALYDPRSSNCCSFDEHDAILDAIAAGDAAAAAESMSSHLALVEHKLNIIGDETPVSLEQVFGGAVSRVA